MRGFSFCVAARAEVLCIPTVFWSIRERVRLNPTVGKSIYIAQSILRLFTPNDFSSRVKAALKGTDSSNGVALCVRIRDEAPNLRVFVEYYLAAGVRHFFFYEARSLDNFREVLKPFIESGHVTFDR